MRLENRIYLCRLSLFRLLWLCGRFFAVNTLPLYNKGCPKDEC